MKKFLPLFITGVFCLSSTTPSLAEGIVISEASEVEAGPYEYRENNPNQTKFDHIVFGQKHLPYGTAIYINQVIKPKIDSLMEKNKRQDQRIRLLEARVKELTYLLHAKKKSN